MRIEFASESRELAEAADKLFRAEAPPETIRQLWESDTGRNPDLWERMSGIGLPGILLPTEHGGSDGKFTDLLLTLEAAGRQAVPDALIESFVVAPALMRAAGDSISSELVSGVADGSVRVSASTIVKDGRMLVPDGHVSQHVLAVASDGVRLIDLRNATMERVESIDPSRRVYAVSAPRENAAKLAVDARDRERVHALALVSTSAQLIGNGRHLIDASARYASVRTQFGRIIGSFQAIKHQLADALMRIEIARHAVYAAAFGIDRRTEGYMPDALRAHVCASQASDLANRVALQVHGGVGFTWEHDLQIWLKRGRVLGQEFGGAKESAYELGKAMVGGPR